MPLLAFSVLVQLLCAVHCVRNGRNGMWLMLILFLSIPGCLAYAWFEILPQYAGRRKVRAAKTAAAKVLDPERAVRIAREALDIANTAANHDVLADALAERSRWREAIPHYEAAAAMGPRGERMAQRKLARALLEAGDAARARTLLEALPPSSSERENDLTGLLLARSLDECGERERALALYADVGERLPGGEAQCRQAGVLLALGRRPEALPLLAEVQRREKRLDRTERANNAAMYDWAAEKLAELRYEA